MLDDIPTGLTQALINNDIAPLSAKWQILTGGRTNQVWRIDHDGNTLVCKLFSPDSGNPLYPNLPGAEYEALKALSRQNIGPKPIALLNSDVGEVLIYQYLQGTVWKDDLAAVATLLARLHRQKLDLPLRHVASGSKALIAQTLAILRDCYNIPSDFPNCPVDGDIAPIKNSVPIHTDVVASNLINTKSGLRLIDWQCPASGDPCEDIASFLSPSMQHLYGTGPLSPSDIGEFLKAYPNRSAVERYLKLAPYFHWRAAAYCQWQAERGDQDYKDAMGFEVSALQ